ncbi:HesB/IscA family protein [Wolbachia endosymbiont of Ctenocephalides felis wCfeT]|uniref:HesB/IscA family protein n=1 Tax=Wolbachia endosymbiont of Ctenocephalides felis wCfeT TaxID=2732593 RepID=UPI001447CE6C|nr:iron-sulfur cluster assembly accessory protein [Wolbachia endosymbiont of Ctenocephalides felis wCfeT]
MSEYLGKNKKDPITITDRALEKVRYLLDQNSSEMKVIGIRILVKQKGCSGLKYTIEYAYDIRPFESLIEASCCDGFKVKVLIDPKSIMFIFGSEMDYVEEKLSSGFVFNNPNEKGKCGCGESFHV